MNTNTGDTMNTDDTARLELPEGVTAHEGADAAADTRRMVQEATRGGAASGLEGLATRIKAEGKPDLALDPLMVSEGRDLQQNNPTDYAALRRDLKGAGVPLGQWDDAVKNCDRAMRAKEKADAQRAHAAKRQAQHDAAEAERAAEKAAAAAAKEQAGADVLALHYADAALDGLEITSRPGRMTAGKWRRTKGGEELEVSTLATGSIIHTGNVSEFHTPTATPFVVMRLSIVAERTGVPFYLDVPADRFDRMEWVPRESGVVVMPDQREKLRAAIGLVSKPVDAVRYGFIGLTEHNGETIFVTAGATLCARGVVENIDTKLSNPADRFALPAPFEGAALRAAAATVLELLAVEPAHVMLPCIALAFRAVLGPCQFIVHVSGLKGLGKSLLVSLVQRFFGASMGPKNLPISWRDTSTVNGILALLSQIGDVVLGADDLQPTPEGLAKFGGTGGAVFNRASPLKRRRDGSARDAAPPRGSLLSCGETLPAGYSMSSRVLSVTLEHEPTPRLESLDARATAGELAGFMAAFICWYLPRAKETRTRLATLDAQAMTAWNLQEKNRAAEILGALALGLSELFAFLRHLGAIDAQQLAAMEARARVALLKASGEYHENVESENPARRFGPTLGEALRSGAAHVVAITPAGGTMTPETPALWGWRFDGEWKRQGPCVGYIRGGEIAIEAGPALRVVHDLAQRAKRPIALEERTLGRDLHAAGVLARTDLKAARRSFTVQFRIGAGVKVSALVLSPAALGMEFDAPDDVPPPVHRDDAAPIDPPAEVASAAPDLEVSPVERVEV